MKAHRVRRNGGSLGDLSGLILCDDVRDGEGRTTLRKGQRLAAGDLATLDRLPWKELHLIEMEPGELHEEEAGRRLAHAVSGGGVTVGRFAGGHWPIEAAHRGLLSIAVDALRRINAVEGACVYTLYDGQVVESGELVARAKIVPFALAGSLVDEVESLAAGAQGVVHVKPFSPMCVGAIVQESISEPKVERFREVVAEKLRWFGATLTEVVIARSSGQSVADAARSLIADGADLLVFAGTKAMDPLDSAFQALRQMGTTLERYGVPAHPGSLLWLAFLDDVPLLGMPTCAMFAQATSFDLVLPRLLAGERVDHAALAGLGHGGLLSKEMSFRFPRYRANRERGELE